MTLAPNQPVPDDESSIQPNREPSTRTSDQINHWPGLEVVPSSLKARLLARLTRPIFRTALHRLPITVQIGSHRATGSTTPVETMGAGGPLMTIIALPRINRVWRGLPHRRLGRRRPSRCLDRTGR
jgi:hypothetical protein